MESNEKILEKIRKVLAKTQNNPSVQEAETAMLIAQRIMVENNLCMEDINLTEVEQMEKETMEVSAIKKKRLSWWEKGLARVIADNFRCKSFVRTYAYGGYRSLCLIGLKKDVEIAQETISYALKVMVHYSSQYVKGHKDSRLSPTQIKNSWLSGFTQGLEAKFKKQVKDNNWGLVLIKDPVVIDAIEKLGLKPGRSGSYQGGDGQAYKSGYRQGQSFEGRAGAIH